MPDVKAFKHRLELPLVPSRWRVPDAAGLLRHRLLSALENPWEHGLVLVIAPAGSGKTTLLSQFAARAEVPVAWFRVESSEREPTHLLRYLEASLRAALPELGGDFSTVEGAAAALDGCRRKAVLVLDDLQAIESSSAEEALGRLLRFLPRNLAVVAASRSSPKFNLSRLRLDGGLRMIEVGDLRFRAWEVERLYRDVYGDPLIPEHLASLTHKTNGWAAGLHMFHLATRGRSLGERRARLDTLSGSSKLIREYLADNVLNELPPRLKEFLVETSVLGRLSARLCDRLLSASGSAVVLEELEGRQLVSGTPEEGYRCHDVLRTHLEAMLVHQLGEAAARLRYRDGGTLLEEAGDHADAVYAFFRAEDWEGVGRLLANEGPRLASSGAPWIDLMPPPIAENPWLLLGAARRHRLAGRWHQAVDTYLKAEAAFHTQAGMETCRSERRAISIWLERPLEQLTGWDGRVRASTRSVQHGAQPGDGSSAREMVAAGLSALLAGSVIDARETLRAVILTPGASEGLVLGARLAEVVAVLLRDPGAATGLDPIVSEADRTGNGWIALLGRAVLALTGRPEGLDEAASVSVHFDGQGDVWGRALAGLLHGLGQLVADQGPGVQIKISEAARDFRTVGATTLEAWCLCAGALLLARSNDPGAREAALEAESVARSAHLSGPVYLAYEALAIAEPHRAGFYSQLARDIRHRSGLCLARPARENRSPARSPAIPVEVRCFGEYRVSIAGEQLNLRSIKPRARQLLRLLSIHYPRPVHLEVIGAALWPESDREVVRRNLQVAVYAVRKLLASGPLVSGDTMLARDGESYGLQLPEGSVVDLPAFEQSLLEGRLALARNDHHGAKSAFQRTLDIHRGDLLGEDGPAEWVVMERERCRTQAVEAAQFLADACRETGDLEAAVRACETGLRLDRFQDNLWRRLILAHRRAGNRAAEMKAQKTYASVLAELGLEQKPAI